MKSRPKHTIKITIASIPILSLDFVFLAVVWRLNPFSEKYSILLVWDVLKNVYVYCAKVMQISFFHGSRETSSELLIEIGEIWSPLVRIFTEMDSKDGATLIKDDFQKAYLRIFWVFWRCHKAINLVRSKDSAVTFFSHDVSTSFLRLTALHSYKRVRLWFNILTLLHSCWSGSAGNDAQPTQKLSSSVAGDFFPAIF